MARVTAVVASAAAALAFSAKGAEALCTPSGDSCYEVPCCDYMETRWPTTRI